jgi:hypothetical protein
VRMPTLSRKQLATLRADRRFIGVVVLVLAVLLQSRAAS